MIGEGGWGMRYLSGSKDVQFMFVSALEELRV